MREERDAWQKEEARDLCSGGVASFLRMPDLRHLARAMMRTGRLKTVIAEGPNGTKISIPITETHILEMSRSQLCATIARNAPEIANWSTPVTVPSDTAGWIALLDVRAGTSAVPRFVQDPVSLDFMLDPYTAGTATYFSQATAEQLVADGNTRDPTTGEIIRGPVMPAGRDVRDFVDVWVQEHTGFTRDDLLKAIPTQRSSADIASAAAAAAAAANARYSAERKAEQMEAGAVEARRLQAQMIADQREANALRNPAEIAAADALRELEPQSYWEPGDHSDDDGDDDDDDDEDDEDDDGSSEPSSYREEKLRFVNEELLDATREWAGMRGGDWIDYARSPLPRPVALAEFNTLEESLDTLEETMQSRLDDLPLSTRASTRDLSPPLIVRYVDAARSFEQRASAMASAMRAVRDRLNGMVGSATELAAAGEAALAVALAALPAGSPLRASARAAGLWEIHGIIHPLLPPEIRGTIVDEMELLGRQVSDNPNRSISDILIALQTKAASYGSPLERTYASGEIYPIMHDMAQRRGQSTDEWVYNPIRLPINSVI